MDINPYLTFDGNARAALEFYADALEGRIEAVQTFGEIPDMPPMEDAMAARLAHGRVIFEGGTLMVSDTWAPEPGHTFSGFSIQTSWDTPDDARAAFDRLSAGGEIVMPMEKTFWAAAFGLCKDRFGVQWMCNCDNPA
ncbi:MAG: glyoxalase/bleomycin resistance/extradiol dioxygenase family protein [Pseudomonadota bacterium]